MINRRNLLALLFAPVVAAGAWPAHAQQGAVTIQELRAVFEQRDIGFRKMAQDGLKAEGYYDGSIDGAWGAGTEAAYKRLMTSNRYRRHADKWTWSREIKIIETLLFLNSDAYF